MSFYQVGFVEQCDEFTSGQFIFYRFCKSLNFNGFSIFTFEVLLNSFFNIYTFANVNNVSIFIIKKINTRFFWQFRYDFVYDVHLSSIIQIKYKLKLLISRQIKEV